MASTHLRAAALSASVVALTASSLVVTPSASANGNCVTYWQSAWSGAPAAGGTGTPADPYLVGSEADIDEVRFCQSAHFRQIANITLTAADWEPISSFSGSYRGESHIITGLAITTVGDQRGLFGTLDGARITGVTLSGVSVSGQNMVGGLAGEATNGTLVSDVTVAGSVSGSADVGGVIGKTSAKSVVRKVTGNGTVTGTSNNAGGLIGSNYDSDLSEAAFEGTVTGTDYTGGAVGYACTGEMDRIAVSGTITGTSTVGGIAGDIECTGMSLTKSTADVTVTGNGDVGGAVGWVYDARVDDVAVTAQITGAGSNVGGVAGSVGGSSTVRNIAATGAVTNTGSNTGGLIGRIEAPGTLTAGVATVTVSGRDQTAGAVGLSSGPVDSVEAAGEVTGRRYTGGLVGLQQNSTLSRSAASGSVTSNGFSTGGLVGSVDQASVVDSHATGAVTQNGGARDTGGLVGTFNSGHVRKSSATGPVTSDSTPAGGLLGDGNDVAVDRSYATGAVTGPNVVGGLIGDLSASISRSSVSDSYAQGDVSGGAGTAGGLIGTTALDGGSDQGKFISHSYASGHVSADIAGGLVGSEGDPVKVTGVSFWNSTANPSVGGPGTAATAAEMQDKATYADDGWEIQSGGAHSATEKIWGICVPADAAVNEGFPFLMWQNESDPCPHEPDAPTLDSVTGTDEALAITATLGADGNSPITDVEYSLDGGAWTSTGGASGEFTISGLTNGVAYAVRVRQRNAFGVSPASNELSGMPEANPTPTPTPTPAPTPTPTPTHKTSLTVKARASGGIPVGRRTALVRSARTDGSITSVRATCRLKGQQLARRAADRICGTQVTAPAAATGSQQLARAAARQRVRISAKPSCSRGVRISVRITATATGARPAQFARTYRVDRGPATICSTRAQG